MARIKNIVLAALLGFTPVAMADAHSISKQAAGDDRPHRGMNMDQVKAKFGAANEEKDAVGDPPISRWVYNDFTVYYEHQHVIHAVGHKPGGHIGASDNVASDDSDSGDRLFLH
jgi:hypothetical protein